MSECAPCALPAPPAPTHIDFSALKEGRLDITFPKLNTSKGSDASAQAMEAINAMLQKVAGTFKDGFSKILPLINTVREAVKKLSIIQIAKVCH